MDKKIFIPGEITVYSLIIIIVIALLFGIFKTPFTTFNTDSVEEISFKIGYPFTMLQLDALEPEKTPIIWGGLILNLIIYFLIAYLLEISYLGIPKLFIKKQRREQINKVDIIRQAREAYNYYRIQGISEENIFKLFQERGWSEEDYIIYIKETIETK